MSTIDPSADRLRRPSSGPSSGVGSGQATRRIRPIVPNVFRTRVPD